MMEQNDLVKQTAQLKTNLTAYKTYWQVKKNLTF